MNDRVGPPAWSVKPDPSDLPRIVRELKKAAELGVGFELTPLGVAVLLEHLEQQQAPAADPQGDRDRD